MLCIVTAVSVLGGVVFLFFARGDVQDWARDASHDVSVELDVGTAHKKDTYDSELSAGNERFAAVHLMSEENLFEETRRKI